MAFQTVLLYYPPSSVVIALSSPIKSPIFLISLINCNLLFPFCHSPVHLTLAMVSFFLMFLVSASTQDMYSVRIFGARSL